MGTLLLGISGARGIVGAGLDEDVARRLACAFQRVTGATSVVLGRDTRLSGPALSAAVAGALRAAGCEVEDLGIVPTPTVQVAVEEAHADGGIVVTASHNPPEWNALKFVGPAGTFLGPSAMRELVTLFEGRTASPAPEPPPPAQPPGAAVGRDASRSGSPGETTAAGRRAIAKHARRIAAEVARERIRGAGLRVVVDAVHGAGQVLIAPLLDELGVEAAWIDGEPDGRLPARPEPRAERLAPLWERVRATGAHVGFAVDPDADRCALVLPARVLGEEWTWPLCALARLRNGGRGPLVTNLSSSAMIDAVAERYAVALYRTPVGEAHVVARAQAVAALLCGEGNGGVIDPRVHWGRDAGVAVALLLDLESSAPGGRGGIAALARTLPARTMVKTALSVDAATCARLGERLERLWGAAASREDGLRWVWPHRWVHLRPSNTEPIVRVIAEAEDADAAAHLTEVAKGAVAELEAGLSGEEGGAR